MSAPCRRSCVSKTMVIEWELEYTFFGPITSNSFRVVSAAAAFGGFLPRMLTKNEFVDDRERAQLALRRGV